jgi:DNA-binding transcriptional ArsR family regulator
VAEAAPGQRPDHLKRRQRDKGPSLSMTARHANERGPGLTLEAKRIYLRNIATMQAVKAKGRPKRSLDQQVALRRFKAEVFQALAHPTRVHIAECLQDGELPVSVLVARVGIEPANLSQHLAVLRAKGLVVNRKEGTQVFYALRDPLLSEVLRNMRRYFQAHVQEALRILKEL